MPSFDVVSEVDFHEVTNAVDQANRELSTRFDFRGVDARFARNDDVIRLTAEAVIQLDQMLDILRAKIVKRSIDPRALETGEQEHVGKLLHRNIKVKQGIESALSKTIVKMIKDKKLKVQVAIQGDKVRVTGKKRDDLQQVISMLKEADFETPLQYDNFRD